LRDVRHETAVAFADVIDWLVYLEVEGKRPKTLYAYTRQIAPLLRAHPDKRLGEFSDTDINRELARIPTRSRYIARSIYNGFFTWAENQERIGRSPMGRVPTMRAPRRRPSELYTEEEVGLLEALPSPDGQLWTILFKTGLRRGEARHLNRSQIDLNRARLYVYDGKGGKDRIVPLPPAALAAVADLDLLERLDRDDYLWYKRPGGGPHRVRREPIGDTTFEHWYKRGVRDAGVRYLNPHQTRHTYGWWLRAEKFDIEERQLMMGHESIRTTERYYGHLTIDDLAEKVAAL
jgi:integrase/recombinase XerD